MTGRAIGGVTGSGAGDGTGTLLIGATGRGGETGHGVTGFGGNGLVVTVSPVQLGLITGLTIDGATTGIEEVSGVSPGRLEAVGDSFGAGMALISFLITGGSKLLISGRVIGAIGSGLASWWRGG